MSTGAKIDLETDYETADGLLKVERYYRSRQRGRYHSADHEMPGFGVNWHGIVPARLLVASSSATIELFTEAGGIDFFSQANADINDFTWVQDGINRRKLSMVVPPTTDRTAFFRDEPSIANGAGEVRLEMGNGEYMLFRRSDVYRIGPSLRYMVPVEHGLPNGYVRYFDYPDTGEYPNRVRDNLGRQLDLTWRDVTYYPNLYQLKVINRVDLPDGTALTYDYAVPSTFIPGSGSHYGVGGSADRLEKVRRVDSAGATLWARDYLYEDVRFPTALTGAKDQNGARLSTYSYSNAGLVSTTERAGGVGYNSVEYLQDAPGQTLQNYVRKVTGPLGHKETYSFLRNAAAPRGMTHVLKSVVGEASTTVPAFSEGYNYEASATYDQTLSSVTDRNDNVAISTLDLANRRPTTIKEANGQPEARQTNITYWPNRDWPASITRGTLKTEYTYTASGQVLTEKLTDLSTHAIPYATGGQIRLTSYTWKPNGRLESVNGPLPVDAQGKDDTATFEYDISGNLLSVTNGLGHVTSFSDYDLNGRPQQSNDANNIITRFEYDPLGRLKSANVKHPTTPADNAISLFDYDNEGRVTGITRPATDTMIMEYNLAGQLTAIRAASGERIDFTYNAAGGVTSQTVKRTDASTSRSITRSFDSLNRMLTETLGVGRTTTWAYDKQGNPEKAISARNNATQMAFDGLNRLISTTHPGGGNEGLGYTPLDDVASSTDAIGVTTDFVRNGFGETIQEVSPDRGTSVYYYNAAGQVSAVIDGRGQRIDYTRDILGRVTAKVPVGRPVSEVVGYIWDTAALAGSYNIGRLARVNDNSGNTRFGYDHRGNLVQRKAQVTNAGTTIAVNLSYHYDLSDRIVQITYPSGRLVAYDRDSKGRVLAIRTKATGATTTWTDIATGMAYEPFAALKQATFGNTLSMTVNWGNDGRLASRRLYKTAGGKNPNLSLLAYSYDNDDNITRIADGVNAAKTVSYEYDVRGRLSAAEQLGSGQVIYNRFDYLHDANGNRTALERRFTKGQIEPDTTDSYTLTPGTNRLASITTASLTRNLIYDNRGNLNTETRGPAVTATTAYDGHGRLIGYARTSEDSLAHTYNGLDDRTATARTPAGGGNADIRRFVTAPDGRAIGEYGSSASDVRAEFIWLSPEVGDSGVFGGDDGSGGYMPIALATAAPGGGTTLNWVHGDHLGTPIVITDTTGIAIAQPGGYTTPAFPGQSRTLYDLYYNRYRDYDPTTGRYIQADPIGLAGGQSPYSYAMGNPLRYTDPSGEFVPTVIPISPLPSPTARWLVRWWNKDDCPDVMPPPPPPPPKQDWCGSNGSEGVPDGNWGEACRTHDACYGTLGANKERCDIRLTIGITNECIIRGMSSNMCAAIGFGYGAGLLVDGIWNPWSPSLEAFRNGQRR